jgi:threonine dehydratase
VGLFADGVAVREVGVETFRLCRQVVDRMVTVDTDAICAAIKDVFEDTRSILEPAGALAVAGLKAEAGQRPSGQRLVAVACGANMNFERLRFVAERAELGEQREAMLAVEIPEQPGSLRRFCRHLGGRSLTEFSYRRAEGPRAHIFVGVRIEDRHDRRELLETLTAAGFPCVDLSDDELAKLHLRHMVGGRRPRDAAAGAVQERLYRFEFPERPGALLDFVNALHPAWTISIFHYRNHGSDVGRIVVGVEVPEADGRAWETVLTDLGFPWQEETANPAYRLFLA